MHTFRHALVALLLLTCANTAQATVTLQIWNTEQKPVYVPGDVIMVLVQHTLDEELDNIQFGSKRGSIYTSGTDNSPISLQRLSPAPDRKEIHVTFTIPADFASNDTFFFFSARMWKSGQPYIQASHEKISLRGIPKQLAPLTSQIGQGETKFTAYQVLGAFSYEFEFTWYVDGTKDTPKEQSTWVNVVNQPVPWTMFNVAQLGDWSWRVRATVDGVAGEWTQPISFQAVPASGVRFDRDEEAIRLYPQPASDHVMISSELGAIRKGEIYDVSGKLLSTQGNIFGGISKLSLIDLSPGMYTVVLTLDDRVVTLPLIRH